MGVLSNKIDKEQLKAGDHIYSWRFAYLYAHHGIYVGEGKVIHFTQAAGQEISTGNILGRIISSSSPSRSLDNPCPACGDQSRLSGVIRSCLDCFLSGGDLYLFEYGVNPALLIADARGGTCTLASSDPQEEVLHRASCLLQNGFRAYHVFQNNREDFAIFCKTGLLISPSAVSAFASSPLTYLTTPLGYLTAFPLSYLTTSRLRYLTTSFYGLSAVGCGMHCINRLVSDVGFRGDVSKVEVESLVPMSSTEIVEED